MAIINEERTLSRALATYFNDEITFSPAITFDALTNAGRNAFTFLIPPGKMDCFCVHIGTGPISLESGRDRTIDTICFLTSKFKDRLNAYLFQQGIIDLICRNGGWAPNNQAGLPDTEIKRVFINNIGIIEPIEEVDEFNNTADEYFAVDMELPIKIIGLRPTITGV